VVASEQAAPLIASQRLFRQPRKIFRITENFGGAGENRTRVLKRINESRYMLSL
jgi:hypothetical protein